MNYPPQAPIASVIQPINTHKESTTNYEVDKTIRHTRQSVGTIKRLSAAVVINLRKDAKGLVIGYGYATLSEIERWGPVLAKALLAELARLPA